MTDIGQMTWNVCEQVTDLCEIFLRNPCDQRNFGEPELQDLHTAHTKLAFLLSAIEANKIGRAA